MNRNDIISIRRPVWIALSELYLDTDPENDDLKRLAAVFFKSPYTVEEIRLIDSYEVAPVLASNLYSSAGEWAGFDENWLVERICSRNTDFDQVYERLPAIARFVRKIFSLRHWKKIEKYYQELESGLN